MSDMYAIKASTLTAIGDAIRGKTSQTKIQQLNYKVSDICMWNATGYDYYIDDIAVKTPYNWAYDDEYPKYTKTIENAHSIRVKGKIYYHMPVSGTSKLTINIVPYEYTSGTIDVSNGYKAELAKTESIKIDTIIENTNIITIDTKPVSQAAYAYYFVEQCEADADDQACSEACKRCHPSFQHEDPSDEAFLCTKAFQRGDIVLLFYDQHSEAAEDVECDDDYDENQDHVDCSLLVFHHLVK